LKKQVAEATAAANAATKNSTEPAHPAPAAATATSPTEATAGSRSAEAPVISPVAEAVPRLDAPDAQTAAGVPPESVPSEPATESSATHDKHQPA
jgi:hypothetical protein